MSSQRVSYYDVLGISPSADLREVQQAFRRQALREKGNALRAKDGVSKSNCRENFLRICEAYQVLCDEMLRATYDQVGEAHLKRGFLANEDVFGEEWVFDPQAADDIFNDFFGTESGAVALMKEDDRVAALSRSGKPPEKAPTLQVELSCTLEQLFAGHRVKATFERAQFLPGDSSQTFARPSETWLRLCPLWRSGHTIMVARQGNDVPGCLRGDLELVLKVQPHDTYELRENGDLTMSRVLPLKSALVGGAVSVRTLDDRKIRVHTEGVVSQGDELRIKGEGFPSNNGQSRGDIVILFKRIRFPKTVDQNTKEHLAHLFRS